MVYRWRCRQCEFTAWAADRGAATATVESHLLEHYGSAVTQDDFRYHWTCPFCEEDGQSYDREETVAAFRHHLFEHVEPLLESGAHVGEEVGGSGSVLVRAPVESRDADNARVHLLSGADVALLVTTNPAARLRLLDSELPSWPTWTVVLTTVANPLDGVEDLDLSDVPLELVKLDRRNGLGQLGETISRIIEERETGGGTLSVEFDILPEIIEKFDLQKVSRFLHILSARLDRADALAHYYIDAETRQESTVNLLDALFDVTIRATEGVFVSRDR